MFADPQSIDVGGGAVSLPRTGSALGVGRFTSADGTTEIIVSHDTKRRNRRVFRATVSKISADALTPTINTKTSWSCYLVLDAPVNGVTATEQINLVKGLVGMLSASTYALVTKFVGGES
jgi:hypothetical protein